MKRFVVREGAACDPNTVKAVQEATGLLQPVTALLCSRGVDTPEAARRFLHPGPEQLHDPFLLPDMAAAVERIRRAVANHEKITVFCDYDADGTCGGSALFLHLRGAGADVSIQTPNRHREGYGLSAAAVEQIAAGGGTLIITVDCGITNVAETALAKSLGVDVIVTDHHECGEVLPDTPYIINAKRTDSAYPYRYLAGCGVAFKLIHALSSLAEAMRYIDLIAIGTITDIVPLLGENRVIAHMGLKKLRQNASAGVAALAKAAGISLPEISSFGIGFGLGPRINAAGRMDTAETAIEILTAIGSGPALKQSVAQLCTLNERRRQEVCDILANAEKMIAEHGYQTDPAILLADSRWNAGVIGIAAAKLAEKYYRPCVLFGGEGDLIGSARSVPGVNIYEVLGAFADSYEKFGGHAQAAGLTIRPERLDSLRADVCAYIRSHYDESAFVPQKLYDMELSAGDVTHRFVEDLARLEPFGPENEQPVFVIRDAALTGVRFVGRDQTHLKFTLKQGDKALDAVSFGFADAHALLPGQADLLCEAGIDGFSGCPQVIVRDFAPRFDETLLKSFLDDNAWRTADGLMNEVVRLVTEGAPESEEAGFARLVDGALRASHFGLCLVAATEPALERLVGMEPVLAALKEGRLVLWDRKSYTPGNCIACGAVPGHPRVIHIGAAEPPAFFDGRLREAYREAAARCFLSRDELLGIYRRLRPLLARAKRTPRDLASQLSLDTGKTAFALRVFAELELIDTDKNDKISFINKTGPRRELRDSAVYRSFEDLINDDKQHSAQSLLDEVKGRYSAEDAAFFEKAYLFAEQAHQGQMRLSGEPFFVHPREVARILVELGLDISTVVAGLFHDIVEDTTVTLSQIEAEFGAEIAQLVDGVTKVGKVTFASKEEHQAEYLRKMFLAMASDIRVILVKLADRLHNMRTLKYQPEGKRIEKAKETLEIFAPLAHRLGINAIKWELEDLSLKYIDEKAYYDIAARLAETRAERREYIAEVVAEIKEQLKKINVEAEVEGRPKHIYSIYNKIRKKQRSFEEVYDLIAVRIIVKTVRDCYAVLGTVHTVWKPIPGRFKDYIAVPKQNMYQSIHTTVVGKGGRPFEVQIRTHEMHSTAEYGIAAHWRYKEGTAQNGMDEKLAWLREMLEWQTDTRDSREFMETLKIDFFSDKVYVFTPKGDVKEFIQGATPLDFAYGIHSEIGNRCIGAKVNGKIVPLSYELKSGDIVEIITSAASKGPSRDWLKIVKTSQAKSKIRNWFRKELKEENIVKGRDMLEKEARRRGYELKDLFKPEWLRSVYKKFTLSTPEDIYAAVGYGGITTGQILHKLIEQYRHENKALPESAASQARTRRSGEASGVIVKGYDDLLVRFAKCCNPVPGDSIVGYITRGRGVSVHRSDCPNVTTEDFESGRMIEVVWSTSDKSSYNVEIQVIADDRNGLIAEVSNKLFNMGFSITSVNARMGKNRTANMVFGFEISDISQLDAIVKGLRSIEGVRDVFRIHK